MGHGGPRCFEHVLVRSLWTGVGDIVANVSPEPELLRRHNGDLPAQRIQRHVLQRHPVNYNPARCRVVEAQQQTYGGCLASPAMSHQGHDLTRRNIQGEALQGKTVRGVTEGHVFERHCRTCAARSPGAVEALLEKRRLSLGPPRLFLPRLALARLSRTGFRSQVHELEDPVGRDQTLLYRQVDFAQALHRTVDLVEVPQISHQGPHGEDAGYSPSGGDDDDDDGAGQHAGIDDRGVQGLQLDRLDASVDYL